MPYSSICFGRCCITNTYCFFYSLGFFSFIFFLFIYVFLGFVLRELFSSFCFVFPHGWTGIEDTGVLYGVKHIYTQINTELSIFFFFWRPGVERNNLDSPLI